MPEQFTQLNSPVRFKASSLGDDDLLFTGLRGREGISQLFSFELDLLAPIDKPIDFAEVLGRSRRGCDGRGEGETRFFHGIVNRVGQGARDNTFISYRMEMVPPIWLLTRRVQSRIFQHQSVPDILKIVLAGFQVTYQIHGTFEPRDFCVQYRESDFAFASRLMEEEGIFYFFQPYRRWMRDGRGQLLRRHTPTSRIRRRSSTTRSRAASVTRGGSSPGRRSRRYAPGR